MKYDQSAWLELNQKISQIVLGDTRSISIKTSGVSSDISGWGEEGTVDPSLGGKSPQIPRNRVMVRQTDKQTTGKWERARTRKIFRNRYLAGTTYEVHGFVHTNFEHEYRHPKM